MVLIPVKDMRKKMLDLYWMQNVVNIKLENNNDNDGKVMLTNIKKNFNRTCYVCGKKGHRKQNFPQKSEMAEGCTMRLKGNCNTCGKKGQRDVNCWREEENASKRTINGSTKAKVEELE